MALIKLLHILSVIIWVGGMFFAYMVLRPSAAEILQPSERLLLWGKVFSRFFKWVWLAVFMLPFTGIYMIFQYGGMSVMPPFIHLMLLCGMVMILIFVYLFFGCYAQFSRLLEGKEWQPAGEKLAVMRKLVAVNLVIGLLTISIAIIGRG